MRRIPLLFAALIALPVAGEPPPEFQKREYLTPGGETIRYVVYVPSKLTAGGQVPFLLYLHGSCAECVTHERILRESNLQFWHGYGRNEQREPTILMAPAGGRGGWTGDDRRTAVLTIVDSLIEEFPIDKRRIYLQGFSMGAAGAWRYLQERPGFFAAANPQAFPGGALDAGRVKDTPIWVTVGDLDTRLEATRVTVAGIRAANGDPRGALSSVTGVNPRFSVFAGTNHGGAQGATQALPGFMEWMYSQINDGNAAPHVRFVEPGPASVHGGSVKAVVAAGDREGPVARVDFFHDDRLVFTDRDPPFEFTYRSLPHGRQTLRARAVDTGGKSETAEVSVLIGDIRD